MKYLVLLGLLFAGPAYSKVNCKTHKVYCKIVKLQPRINKKFAMKLSNYIYKGAKANGTDPMLSVAILNQESSLRSQHTWKISRKMKTGCSAKMCTQTITEVHKVVDMTIAQINVRTAVDYGIDIKRLFDNDVEYAIQSHFVILKDKIRMCKELGDDAWSCYHSKTQIHRLKYIQLVSRYL